MDQHHILLESKSAHHGYINYENQLTPALKLFEREPDIGIIEIDFIYHNGGFISSHDYSNENIAKGSSLEQWIDYIIYNEKILWIDIKDCPLASISNDFSIFNTDAFYNYLDRVKIRFPNLKNYILIGCQYEYVYQQLLMKNTGYTLIHDMPQDYAYLLDTFLPLFIIKSYVQEKIMEDLQGKTGIVCLDRTFFDDVNDLNNFISKLSQKIIIVYSYNLYERNLPKVDGKHIIHQFNYRLY